MLMDSGFSRWRSPSPSAGVVLGVFPERERESRWEEESMWQCDTVIHWSGVRTDKLAGANDAWCHSTVYSLQSTVYIPAHHCTALPSLSINTAFNSVKAFYRPSRTGKITELVPFQSSLKCWYFFCHFLQHCSYRDVFQQYQYPFLLNFFCQVGFESPVAFSRKGEGEGRRGGEGARDLLAIAHSLPGFTNNTRFSYVEINSENSDG